MNMIGRLSALFFLLVSVGAAEPWENFREGIPADKVPAPWTDVKLDDMKVEVWGRTFYFRDSSPLPVRIVSQGQDILAAPMTVKLEPAPKKWTLISTSQPNPTTALFRYEGTASGVRYLAETSVYFDGVIRFELTVPGGAKVQRYSLEAQCPRKIATYIHRGPWKFGGLTTGYACPAKKEEHPIRNVFFLMNEFVGLGWFDGMNFDWPLTSPGKALELIPSARGVTLRVNYIDQGKVYPRERVFSSGFQVLPVRPMPRVCEPMRMSYSVIYSDENPRLNPAWTAPVEYDATDNLQLRRGTVELWVKTDPSMPASGTDFFYTSHGRYYRLYFGYNEKEGLYVKIPEQYQERCALRTGKKIEPGRWTHVAFTWGDALRIYADGVLCGEIPWRGSSSVMPMLLHVGGKYVEVDALRISKTERSTFDRNTALQADADTLLLDNFEKSAIVNGRQASIPDKISTTAECGYWVGDGKCGEGVSGLGVAPLDATQNISMVEAYARLGANALLYHAPQPTGHSISDLSIAEPERFAQSVAAIRKANMKPLMYVNNSLANTDPLWGKYADLWLIEPRETPFIPANRPNEKNYQACPRSGYIDYFFWRIASHMDQDGIAGVFLDGRMYATCFNKKHGCSVVNFDGQEIAKRDVWDGRLKAWRLYNIVQARGGYSEQHKSSLWDAPSCFFWDGIWEGEQFMNLKAGERSKLEILPLQGFRMLLSGFAFGMPTRFASYAWQPFSPVECCTFAFVHGTTWTQTYRIDEMQTISPYWKALERFGADYHNFLPYWAPNPPAASTPTPLVKVSAYCRDKSALLIVANFDEKNDAVQGNIKLNPAALGVKPPFEIVDAFSDAPIPMSNDLEFEIRLKSFRQSWFLVREKR